MRRRVEFVTRKPNMEIPMSTHKVEIYNGQDKTKLIVFKGDERMTVSPDQVMKIARALANSHPGSLVTYIPPGADLEMWEEVPDDIFMLKSAMLAALIAVGSAHDRAVAGIGEKSYKKALHDIQETLGALMEKTDRALGRTFAVTGDVSPCFPE